MIGLIFRNHYERLEVARDATGKEISQAFRRLARTYHPDVAEDKARGHKIFLLLKESNEVLRDPKLRREYDEMLAASERFRTRKIRENDQRKSPPPVYKSRPSNPPSSKTKPREPVFDRKMESRPDLDTFATLEITLEESLEGGSHNITVVSELPPEYPDAYSNIQVKVPPKAYQGQQIRVRNQGLKDPKTLQRGDLVLTVDFSRHEIFRRLGVDLYATVDIFPWDAALGGLISVPTLEGIASLPIPKGTQVWQSFRMNGLGVYSPENERGDLIIALRIHQPPAQTPLQAQLWRSLKHAYKTSELL